jgi:DHA2 family multidrug resistance protein
LNTLAAALQSRGTDSVTAKQQALAVLSQTVDLQASVLAYADLFRVVGVVFLCSLPLLLLLGKGDASADLLMGH